MSPSGPRHCKKLYTLVPPGVNKTSCEERCKKFDVLPALKGHNLMCPICVDAM
ncbi:hypothetical protein M758_6G053300 [Ceratodon purpureus]|nr:hypothetical protein M758_6G053300 [Ceratodon purpureus]